MNYAPLQGIKVVDFTSVQSGPSCTQMLAWLGAEVIKIERPGSGDATRNELQFDPKLPSYYFLQLNSDKKSLTLDAATPDGKEILTKLIQGADIFVENLHPGAMDKLGFSWEEVHKLNPRCIYGSIKGFPESSKFKNLKAYEPIAQVTAAAATPTGWGHNTGEGVFVYQSMHNACLNLCRIKTRDQLTLDKIGYLTQYMQYPNEKFPDYVPRSGNTEGSGVLGWTYKCKGWENDANAYAYIIFQRGAKDFEKACQAFGFEDWLTNPDFNTAEARDRNKQALIDRVQQWALQYDKYEIVDKLAPYGVPCAPVINTKELMEDQSLYDGNTLVKINQPGAVGEFVTVGCPFTMSNYTPAYGPCPELGGNNDEVLKSLGYTEEQIQQVAKNGTTEPLPDGKM